MVIRRKSAGGNAARKLAAILIADAVGYSRLVGADERAALSAFRDRRSIIEKAVAKYRGRIFGGAGDSVVAEFPSAVDAMHAALLFQEGIGRLNAQEPAELQMTFRVGINLGDVIVEGDNLLGEGINIAERLQAAALPGGVCVSGSVHEQTIGRVARGFADLGELQLKNIGHAVRAYRVLAEGESGASAAAADSQPPQASALPRKWLWSAVLALIMAGAALFIFLRVDRLPDNASTEGPPVIAVLPLSDLSGDPAKAYFSEGVSQDIVSALGRFSKLSVISYNAAKQMAADSTNLAAAAKKLNVRYLVTGTIRQNIGHLRISVDLSDTGTQRHLWAQQYDREQADIFAVQDEIMQNIVGALAIKVTQIEQQRSIGKPTERLDAYDLLLRGRAQAAQKTLPNLLQARSMFEKAIEIDPHYPNALAALGFTYHAEATAGYTEFIADALTHGETLANQALSFQPDLTDAHQLLALISLARNNYDLAKRQMERALALNPSDAENLSNYGSILLYTGDAAGAIRATERALKFDPTLDIDRFIDLGIAYFVAGRCGDATALLEPIAIRAGDYALYAALAGCYGEMGRPADAARAVQKVKRLWPFFKIADYVDQFQSKEVRQRIADSFRKAGLE